MTLKLLKNNKINNNDNMNTLDISLSDQTLNEVERNTIGIISLDKFTLFSSSLSKIILSLLSLGKCSETRGSIFSLSSLGLSRRSINKDFNTMDSRVYANASHENDILKKLSLGLTRGSISQHIRFITLICSILLTSTVATAEDTTVETCANGDGTVIVGVITGHKYCRSNMKMNWWNAYAWCDGLKRRMFSMDDCQSFNATEFVCNELKDSGGSGWCWTANPSGSSKSYYVNAASGFSNPNTHAHDRRSDTYDYALCY